MMSRIFSTPVLLAVCLLLPVRAARAGDLTVMTSGAFTAAYLELVPQLERLIKGKVVTAATAMGTGSDSITSRLERGEPADIVILTDEVVDQLIKQGRILANSRVALARSSIGMAVRAGAPKPDISTLDALKRTLLQAKSVAYSAQVSGIYISTELFQRLGIADQMRAKSQRVDRERVGAVVARGDADIGFQQISELLSIPGIDYGATRHGFLGRHSRTIKEAGSRTRGHHVSRVTRSPQYRCQNRSGAGSVGSIKRFSAVVSRLSRTDPCLL
jgi:molybdate transport system substrate-binding protein